MERYKVERNQSQLKSTKLEKRDLQNSFNILEKLKINKVNKITNIDRYKVSRGIIYFQELNMLEQRNYYRMVDKKLDIFYLKKISLLIVEAELYILKIENEIDGGNRQRGSKSMQ